MSNGEMAPRSVEAATGRAEDSELVDRLEALEAPDWLIDRARALFVERPAAAPA